MRIVHLTPGTGNFHCGSCHRDNYLMKALRAQGHDVTMVPLYLPLVTDGDSANPELPVFAGGINLFLNQKLPFLRKAPRWLHKWLDSPSMLLRAAKRASMTSPRQLGEMTVESLRGINGRQAEEWQQLIEWVGLSGKPHVLSLSNGLLNGLAVAAQRDLDIPVVCSLQGEDSFLDILPEPYRTQSWDLFRQNSQYVARYVATSDYYAATMRERLGLSAEKLVCVRNGLDLTGYSRKPTPPGPPVIGYLARQIAGKGLHTLVDAFILLAPRLPQARLSIAGTATAADKKFIAKQQAKLKSAGLWERVHWRYDLDVEEKIAHFQSLSVLSVPATYGEAFGLYILESLACGVPVVEPDHAGPGELVRATGGGLLCTPDDPLSLADNLHRLLTDHALRQSLADTGFAAVTREFSAERMARDYAAVCAAAVSV
jgi:glycosyltransferase involved in cell wall biosynthesis